MFELETNEEIAGELRSIAVELENGILNRASAAERMVAVNDALRPSYIPPQGNGAWLRTEIRAGDVLGLREFIRAEMPSRQQVLKAEEMSGRLDSLASWCDSLHRKFNEEVPNHEARIRALERYVYVQVPEPIRVEAPPTESEVQR